ncbi:MAG: BolA/IbaG family iron-sulfur metabolism protein [Sphingomonadaceae bacterium]
MPMSGEEIVRRIRAALPDAEVSLEDLAGDDDHWEATIVSNAFAGLSRVAQHRLVYQAIGSDMGGALHALKLNTRPRSG